MKREVLYVCIIMLIITMVIPTTAKISESSQTSFLETSWPMFRHDSHHTGVSKSAAPNTNYLNWSSTPGGIIATSPTIVNDRIFIGGYIDACPPEGIVFCINATDGNLIWSYQIESVGGISSVVESTPAVALGKVFVGCNDGYLYCLDAEGTDGGQTFMLWRTLVNSAQGFRRKSSPTVEDKMVYINGGHVYCLWAENGTIKWQTESPNGESSPVVSDDRVFYGTNFEWVHCANKSTGEELWNKRVGDFTFSSPTYSNNRFYIGADNGKVYCFDTNASEYGFGIIIWSYQTSGHVYSSPAYHNGKIFIGSNDGNLYCLDAEGNGDGTTSVLWSNYTGSAGWSSPAVADGKIYIGAEDGSITCLNETTGEIIWTYTTGDSTGHSSPAVADGKVFIGSLDGFIYCFGGTGQVANPNLHCEGNLNWNDVQPGDIVNGSFQVENIGDPESLLDWQIESWPDWGEWSFTPSIGEDLTPGEGSVTIEIEVIAPEDVNTEFEGEIIVKNTDEPEDSCTIPVMLITPTSHESVFHRFSQVIENILEKLPILEQVLLLLQMCFRSIFLD
jgi:outer membrane protein assembly factor BamB